MFCQQQKTAQKGLSHIERCSVDMTRFLCSNWEYFRSHYKHHSSALNKCSRKMNGISTGERKDKKIKNVEVYFAYNICVCGTLCMQYMYFRMWTDFYTIFVYADHLVYNIYACIPS